MFSNLSKQDKTTKKYSERDTAIIGMACNFPKSENCIDFWDNLINNKNTLVDINKFDINDPNIYVTQGGFINPTFDNDAFKISNAELQQMSLAQKIALDVACKCTIDSNTTTKNVGVFVGNSQCKLFFENHRLSNEYASLH